jgi:sporulation protein YlmC with PRC-barrel domain
MTRSLLLGALSIVCTAIGPVHAQTRVAGGTEFLTEAPNTFRVSKTKGIAVIGQDHTRLGEVEDLLIDRAGKVQTVVIEVGGVLGLGERTVGVPFGQVLWNTGDVSRQSDLGASTAPAKETGPETTPHKTPDRMPGANVSPEVLKSTADQSSGATNPATGPVTAAEPTQRATAILVPPSGTLRQAEIRATKAEIQQAPEFKPR